jgi:D-aspartate ligase
MTWLAKPRKTANNILASGSVPGAVILGGAIGSLAVARSLGRRGIPVWFVGHDHPITRYSRYTTRSIAWDGPDHDGAAPWLIELAKQNGLERWVLFAGADPEVRLVARHHSELA